MVDWRELDQKWQQAWREARLFEAKPEGRPKFYLTVAYPYVSGPMHVGHGRTYTVPDVIARYKRMRGYNVLFPMAYHFTGTPIVGAAKRVERREPGFIRVLLERFGVKEQELPKFEDPQYFATHFARLSELSYRKGMEMLGYSIDWRREFTTVDPAYKRFITWQFKRLMEAGVIVKGKHPVKWCPSCGNPVTDHDLLQGEGVDIVEFTLLKYKLGDYVLPAATLRPETVFGVTNLWLNPSVKYVVASVNGERWVISPQAVKKLREQGYEVGEVKPLEEQLVGKEVEVPLTHERVLILPAEFVDPENATGVVGSVPAHAPYDLVALEELRAKPEELESYGIAPGVVEGLKPISLIKLEGYGESPAVDVVKRMGIKSQRDPKLEEATAEVYRNEFAKGYMREWVPDYGGMPVARAKEEVKGELVSKGEGAVMYEFSAKPVVCRCGSGCVVKVVEDQWFLNYADEEWKARARECLKQMHLVPPETRAQFEHVMEWLHEWPCTRKIGLGTPAPWDPSWIIESLSDSTIYMAYYTIAHLLRGVDPAKLTEEVFDYVFLGRGSAEEVARATGIEAEVLKQMRREFEYWYPLDYRMSANELIPNHLTFHIFHHVQIFPPERWPRGIVSFGMAVLEGEKMSSSKGNIIAINEAVKKYGADVVRLYLMSTVEPWQDLDWRARGVEVMQRQLERFYSLAEELARLPSGEGELLTSLDRWMLSRLQYHIRATTQALEGFETRKAVQHAFFELANDVRRYLRRTGKRGPVLKRVLEVWLRLLAPFAPHVCEELWHRMGKPGFISTEPWPEAEERLVDKQAELIEDYLDRVLGDVREIIRVLRVEKPKRVCLYVAERWKQEVYREALERSKTAIPGVKELLGLAQKLGVSAPEAAKFAQHLVKELKTMAQEQISTLASVELDEFEALSGAREFIKQELGAEVKVFRAEDPSRYDPKHRAGLARPLKPAIFVE